ncbi:hypothetical protein [Streptomyces gobitricini]|uniref:Uncharacterized protein n=1 Tax=Streptomyces gobitricini TaxID=68211 RepID=A0ABN3N9N1_9ACTN
MAGDLKLGVDALITFRSRVDAVLTQLEGGDGGAAKVAAERVTRTSFGGDKFDDAQGFYLQYNRVHKALVSLSKSLGDQIELLAIGVHAADVGYDNVDEAQRRRFHEIQARLSEEREAALALKEQAERAKQGDKPAAAPSDQPLSGDKGVKQGLG